MSLLDDVLAANSAVVEGTDVPVPAIPEDRRVVVVTCSEIRAPGGRDLAASLGFAHDEAFVVANAGGRVHAPDGDVARSVALALAQAGGGEVFVVAHENCRFLAADSETVASLLAAPSSSLLAAVESLCGESFISARKLAMSAAETLRASPFLPTGSPVHALVFNEGRGRLSAEERGYDKVGAVRAAIGAASPSFSVGGSPSPILGAPGVSSFGGAGPVSLFGSGPSPLMGAGSPTLGAPSPIATPSPDLAAASAAASAFLAPPSPPSFTPPPTPVGFVPPVSFPALTPPPARPAPAPEPLTFQPSPSPPPPPLPTPPTRTDAKPAPRKPSSDVDDPFRKAAETLERLRRERRK